MESILHYIWKNRLADSLQLETTTGESVQIIEPGKCNNKNSCTYNDAIIKIGANKWAGSVSLGNANSNEASHCSNIILYVALSNSNKPTATPQTDGVSQLYISCPEELKEEIEAALQRNYKLPCGESVARMPKEELHNNLEKLFTLRIEEKTKLVERIFHQCDQRWDDALLKTAIRSFGFGIQSDLFDAWGSILNTQALAKHRDNKAQVEALFFGQAGLLEEESIPDYYRTEALKSNYFNELKREYLFLKNKFNLESLDHSVWRGGGAPHLRIARLAALYHSRQLSISSITDACTLTGIYKLLNRPLDGYWQNHTCFGSTETTGTAPMKSRHIDIIIINSIIPILHIYGKHRKEETLCKTAYELMHQIKAEENSIIKKWCTHGLNIKNAAHSQALLQLERSYCKVGNCTECPFAHYYIKERLQNNNI